MNLDPRNPKKKCICKNCDDCHFYRFWSLIDEKGENATKQVCSLDVAFQTIPKLVGSIDGCQQATNETRNMVYKYGNATKQAFEQIAENTTRLLPDGDS